MKFLEVKIGEFPGFIESDLYKQWQHLPITKERAISQFHNPHADKNEVGLIVALDESNDVAGYIGIIPDVILWKGNQEKFYWNSCWWVHPEKGKQTAMPLFYRMLKLTGMKQIFFELTPVTKYVVEKLPYFHTNIRTGKRFFLRFYLSELMRKKERLHLFSTLFSIAEAIGNGILKMAFKKSSYDYKIAGGLDDEANEFISPFLQQQVLQRGREELNWILDRPWLTTDKPIENEKKYYFSHQVSTFAYYPIKLYERGKLYAFLLLYQRDGHFSLPYFFCNNTDVHQISGFLKHFLRKQQAKSFITFHPMLLSALEETNLGQIYAKKIIKYMGFPVDEKYIDLENQVYQDGDGDVVFTG